MTFLSKVQNWDFWILFKSIWFHIITELIHFQPGIWTSWQWTGNFGLWSAWSTTGWWWRKRRNVARSTRSTPCAARMKWTSHGSMISLSRGVRGKGAPPWVKYKRPYSLYRDIFLERPPTVFPFIVSRITINKKLWHTFWLMVIHLVYIKWTQKINFNTAVHRKDICHKTFWNMKHNKMEKYLEVTRKGKYFQIRYSLVAQMSVLKLP